MWNGHSCPLPLTLILTLTGFVSGHEFSRAAITKALKGRGFQPRRKAPFKTHMWPQMLAGNAARYARLFAVYSLLSFRANYL
jgi:hypothetical protein